MFSFQLTGSKYLACLLINQSCGEKEGIQRTKNACHRVATEKLLQDVGVAGLEKIARGLNHQSV